MKLTPYPSSAPHKPTDVKELEELLKTEYQLSDIESSFYEKRPTGQTLLRYTIKLNDQYTYFIREALFEVDKWTLADTAVIQPYANNATHIPEDYNINELITRYLNRSSASPEDSNESAMNQ